VEGRPTYRAKLQASAGVKAGHDGGGRSEVRKAARLHHDLVRVRVRVRVGVRVRVRVRVRDRVRV
jgi:hypothetical protein